MKRLAIAIGAVIILAAGVALWALTRPGGSQPGVRAVTTERGGRPETSAGNDQPSGGSPGPAERGAAPTETRDQTSTRGQASAPSKDGIDRSAAPEGGSGRWGPPSEMSEADRAKMRDQMMERMLDDAGLSAKEKTAARSAIKANDKARQTLVDQLTRLRRTANKSQPTDEELKEALAAYRSALARYRKEVATQDATLVKQLSLKGQARFLSLGVLDNGLGGFGPGGPGGFRPPR
jgi:hypothetical protein